MSLPQFVPAFKDDRRSLKVGSVLIQEENQKRIEWKLGRVQELILSLDKKVHSVKLKTETLGPFWGNSDATLPWISGQWPFSF